MLGCDIIEIDRIKDSIERFGKKFINRILTEREIEIYERRNYNPSFAAGRFAAKESISKTMKSGIGSLSFKDIEIVNDDKGAPLVFIKGEKRPDVEVSISHSRDYAVAVSILVREVL